MERPEGGKDIEKAILGSLLANQFFSHFVHIHRLTIATALSTKFAFGSIHDDDS